MSLLTVVLLAAALLVLVLVVSWCVSRARRLDRLHVRLDAARAALDTALERRAAVAERVAPDGPVPAAVRVARRAVGVDAGEWEDAQSALTRALAALDRTRLAAVAHEELVDAEQLVVLARRVHNDAVRDTLALRSRRLVRWLRLAGTAPAPRYFDIAEPEPDGFRPGPHVTQGSTGGPVVSRTLG
jgi:hypothetical protein